MSEVANEVVTRFVEITKEEPNRCGWLIECSLQRTGELFRFVDPAPGDR